VFLFVTTLIDGVNLARRLRLTVFSLWLFFPVAAFISNINVSYTHYWLNNRDTKQIVEVMVDDSRKYGDKGIFCGVSTSFEQYPVVNYYIFKNKASWLNPIHFQEVGIHHDRNYIVSPYLKGQDNDEHAQNLFSTGTLRLLKHEPKSQPLVIVDTENFESTKEVNRESGRNNSYAERIFSGHSTRLMCDSILTNMEAGAAWQAEFYVRNISHPADVGVIFQVMRNEELIEWRWCPVYSTYESTDEWTRVRLNMYFNKPLITGDRVYIYAGAEFNSVIAIDDLSMKRLF
jgi:hypothetical protein